MGKIVTRPERARKIVRDYEEYWSRTPYWETGWPKLSPPVPPAKQGYAKLLALGPDPDPDRVEEILGANTTFAACDQCGEWADTVAEFDVNCGEFTVEICERCCESLTDQIRKAPAPQPRSK